jgi:serine phosphatase RsbU (regulator of sigma subunit)
VTIETQPLADEPAASSRIAPLEAERWRPSKLALIVLLVGAIVTAGLTIAASSVYDHNEDRLIDLRVREVGLLLQSAVGTTQTPLTAAVELAEATNGNSARFMAMMAPRVGKGRQFASASLWTLRDGTARRIATVGQTPVLAAAPTRARRVLATALRTPSMTVTGFLSGPNPRLGYALHKPGSSRYVVYAENPLPKNRRSRLDANAAFSELNYAIYLGRSPAPSKLLVTSLRQIPSEGRLASHTMPFGNTALTLVVVPRGSLGGSFFHRLPLVIAVVGALLAAIAALLTDRLVRRRRRAEELADVLDYVAAENHQLYNEQRSIAQTLQHAMLPETLSEIPGTQLAARYVPAASGIDVGGDWYDVVALDEDRLLVVIGDVSGHGLEASTTMAALRHAALAYVVEEPRPSTVLTKLSEYADATGYGFFATVLCAVIDLGRHELTVATAGHPAPLLLTHGDARYVELAIGPPVGAPRGNGYGDTTTSVPAEAALLMFTDGLVERRGELIDIGFERVRRAAAVHGVCIEQLIENLAGDLEAGHHDDDAAILGVRWRR